MTRRQRIARTRRQEELGLGWRASVDLLLICPGLSWMKVKPFSLLSMNRRFREEAGLCAIILGSLYYTVVFLISCCVTFNHITLAVLQSSKERHLIKCISQLPKIDATPHRLIYPKRSISNSKASTEKKKNKRQDGHGSISHGRSKKHQETRDHESGNIDTWTERTHPIMPWQRVPQQRRPQQRAQ